MQKKVAIVQDVSCMGKCSTLVASPIISAFSHEVHLLPTAIFSAHTGFEHHNHIDLTDFMKTVLSDWKKQDLQFDGIYSGYLLNSTQAENVMSLIKDFSKGDTVILIDPVIGDNGKPYSFLSEQIKENMLRLIEKSTVITPNLTEVSLLLGSEMIIKDYDKQYIEKCLRKFKEIGCEFPLITGVSFDESEIGVAYLVDDEVKYQFRRKYDSTFSGTGDTFASVLFSALLKDFEFEKAVSKALDLLQLAIKDNTCWYGIDFEKILDVSL